MDFAFGDEQDLLRDTTRRFLDDRQSLEHVRRVIEAENVFDPDVWRRGAELGWTAMLVPVAYGGGAVTHQPLVDLTVLAEELGRVLYPGPFLPTNVVADAVTRFGSDEARAGLLPGLASGDLVAAWCPGDRPSDATDPGAVRAQSEGETVRLDGVTRYVHGAAVRGSPPRHCERRRGHRARTGPTVRLTASACARCGGLDLTRRIAEISFDNVTVPSSARLARSAPSEILERTLAVAAVLQAAEAVGAADHVVATTLEYAKHRVQFGRPIGSFQAIKHRLADLHITLEAMRAATHYAALALGDGFDDAAEAVAVAGSYVGDAYLRVCGEAVQLHGGIGFTWEHDLHLFVRRATVDRVLYGDPSWHRERLCAIVEAVTA